MHIQAISRPAEKNRSSDLVAEDRVDVLGLFRTLWRGKGLIVLALIVSCLLGGWYAFVISAPTYRSTAEMSLVVRTENFFDVDAVLTGVTPDQTSINTEMTVLKSRHIIGRLVDALDLVSDPEFNQTLRPLGLAERGRDRVRALLALPPGPTLSDPEIRNAVIDRLREAIRVTPQDRSYVFTISARSNDPEKSARIANALARLYSEDQVAQKMKATEEAALWLSERVAELEVEIAEAESEINTLRTRNTLVSAEAIAAINIQSAAATENLQNAEHALRRAKDRMAAFAASLADDYATRASLSGDPQLLALSAEASSGDLGAIEHFDRRAAQILMQQRGDVARSERAVEELRQHLDTIAARFQQQSAVLIEIGQTERDIEATRILYETFLTRLKETTVQIGVHQADSRLLSEAIPGIQVAPRTSLILALSAILGLGLGITVVLIREALQTTFRSASQLEQQTGEAVLGQIPRIASQSRLATLSHLRDMPSAAAAEAIRNLRTSVLMSGLDRPHRIIMVTSSVPAEGKTTVTVALAQSLAGMQKRVLLVEGDIRSRTFMQYFPQARQSGGLLAALDGTVPLEEAVWTDPSSGLNVLAGRESPVNAGDVLSSDRFRQMLAKLRENYDHVLIDTPPVLAVPDARIIGGVADAILYTVRWDKTTRAQVDAGLRQMRLGHAPIMGLVLSQVDAKRMRGYGYGDEYGAYCGGSSIYQAN